MRVDSHIGTPQYATDIPDDAALLELINTGIIDTGGGATDIPDDAALLELLATSPAARALAAFLVAQHYAGWLRFVLLLFGLGLAGAYAVVGAPLLAAEAAVLLAGGLFVHAVWFQDWR